MHLDVLLSVAERRAMLISASSGRTAADSGTQPASSPSRGTSPGQWVTFPAATWVRITAALTRVVSSRSPEWLLSSPAVNLVSRLEGLCRPLGRSVLIGAVAAETTTPLVPLGEHMLRGIAAPCTVFTLPDA